MRYGALSVKARALYGKRLRTKDFAWLAGLKSETEILEALRQHPGWSRALAKCETDSWRYVGRVELEAALREELRLECLSLSHYVPRKDRKLMEIRLDVLAHRTDFFQMFRMARKQYSGPVQKTFIRAIGSRADLLNIIHILRLKTSFPDAPQDKYLTVLFPVHYRLKPELLRQMCAAADTGAVFELLKQTPYRDCLEGPEVLDAEESYRRAIYTFNRRQLLCASPSIYTAMAYLDLKEMEMAALVNVIESVKYGVPYQTALAELVGA